jgi:hypothetical protein
VIVLYNPLRMPRRNRCLLRSPAVNPSLGIWQGTSASMGKSLKSFSFTLIFAFFISGYSVGQTGTPAYLSVCRLLADPARHSGDLVMVKAEVTDPRRVRLLDPDDPKCGRIPWMFPTNPDVKPDAKFPLVRDAKFKQLLDSLGLTVPPPPGSGRSRKRIIAVLEGRFDSVYRLKDGKVIRSANGIGYLGADEHVFVLHRVLKTDLLPID